MGSTGPDRPGPVYLTRRGRRVAGGVDGGHLEQLLGVAEDLADIQAAAIPWNVVEADLALV